MRRSWVLVGVWLALAVALAADGEHSINVFKDLHTVHSEDANTFLDLYVPEGVKNLPVFIFIHGGAWRTGDKSQYENIGRSFAKAGIAVAVINYPLNTLHPAHVRQAAYAVGWVRGNAPRYGWDPKKIFIGGHSAGGHMAALLTLDPQYLKEMSLKPSDVRGCVVLDAVALDLEHARERPPLLLEMYSGAFGAETGWKDASPMTYATGKGPPFLLMIGAQDDWISHEDTRQFAERLKSAGTPVETITVPDRDHFGMVLQIGATDDPVSAKIIEFIRQNSRSDP
jgi:acetyl esterase/lipase